MQEQFFQYLLIRALLVGSQISIWFISQSGAQSQLLDMPH